MTTVNASPEAMRALAMAVDTFTGSIQTASAQLRQASETANENWMDDVFNNVQGLIEEILTAVEVSEAAGVVTTTIEAKAAQLDEFLSS